MAKVDQRRRLVDSPNVFFHYNPDIAASQRADFLNPAKTSDELVALIIELAAKGNFIQFTSVNSDHHDDLSLGQHGHTAGQAVDCWPLASREQSNWAGNTSARMSKLLIDFSKSKYAQKSCLGGSAYCDQNLDLLGVFRVDRQDGPNDHVHFQAKLKSEIPYA